MSTKIKCKYGKLKVPVRRPDGRMRYCKRKAQHGVGVDGLGACGCGSQPCRCKGLGGMGGLSSLHSSSIPILFVALALGLGISDAQRGI
ncbi:MAG: hypothetical protein GY772_29275 [bacterium]|nr:hypothetical protein [bacterium]